MAPPKPKPSPVGIISFHSIQDNFFCWCLSIIGWKDLWIKVSFGLAFDPTSSLLQGVVLCLSIKTLSLREKLLLVLVFRWLSYLLPRSRRLACGSSWSCFYPLNRVWLFPVLTFASRSVSLQSPATGAWSFYFHLQFEDHFRLPNSGSSDRTNQNKPKQKNTRCIVIKLERSKCKYIITREARTNLKLAEKGIPIKNKKITAELCNETQ